MVTDTIVFQNRNKSKNLSQLRKCSDRWSSDGMENIQKKLKKYVTFLKS